MKTIKKTGIIGAGCLGIMFYQMFEKKYGRGSVFFIADKERIERYARDGIYCNGEKCDFNFVDKDEPCGDVDLIMFANKFTTIDEAIEAVCGFVGEETILISIINGIASEQVIGERLNDEHLLYCVVHGMDSTKRGKEVTYSQTGKVIFGDRFNRKTEDLEAVYKYMSEAGVNCMVPEDIRQKMWSKLMFNVGVNQVSAVFNCSYAGLQRPGKERDIMLKAMGEARKVASLEGVVISDEDLDEWMRILSELTPESMPSMQQDVLAKRKTELGLFAGTIRRLAEKHGVDTPVNDYLYDELVKIEASWG